MYLKSVQIQDIKCFESVNLDFCHPDGQPKRWNVILGENGTGKSTLLQAIALALMGPDPANRLQRPDGWVRTGRHWGKVIAKVQYTLGDKLSGGGRPRVQKPYEAACVITGTTQIRIGGVLYDRPTVVFEGTRKQLNALKRGPWSERSIGWFSCGYGPFRRLRGGSRDALRLIYPGQQESRFVTLFREDAALEDLDEWLRDLDHRRREEGEGGEHAREVISAISAVTTHLLPEGVRLESIGPDGTFFSTPYSPKTRMTDLSDGYRAMLALATDLLRRLDDAYDRPADWVDDQGRVTANGVVLVDELDAHLHPVWQREIGFWLREQFPNIQFIVATHSPFVPQAADDNAVFVLRQAKGKQDRVVVEQDIPSVRGWRAEQILTALFSLSATRSPEAERKMRRYAELKAKAEATDQLSMFDAKELGDLEAWIQTELSPPGETTQEMQHYRDVRHQVEGFLRLQEGPAEDA